MRVTVLILTLLIGCGHPTSKNRIIDTGKFEIEVPSEWQYKEEQGIDSFVGYIVGDDVDFSFDWSEMGYANHLVPDEREFIYEQEWEWMPLNLPYAKEGVIYTSGNVEGERQRIMKEQGINDPSLVKVEPFQIPEKEIVFQEDKYIATLTYQDTVVKIKIEVPKEISEHHIQVDTIGNYKRKIIWPRDGAKGTTGIYFEDLKSSFNFNLAGEVEGMENQKRAIEAFKTIKLKR